MSMLSLRRSSGMLRLAVAAVTAVGPQAGPAQAGPVGPKQYFTGVINGKDGNTTIPITIKMACAGPGRPGQTGHPLAGQTLAVHQLFPPVRTTSGSLGSTGGDSKIGQYVGPASWCARLERLAWHLRLHRRTLSFSGSMTARLCHFSVWFHGTGCCGCRWRSRRPEQTLSLGSR